MFGCGSLQLGCSWFNGAVKDAAVAQKWATTLDPAFRLPASKTPMNWCATTNDNFYWMPALMDSYQRAGGPKHLALLPNWNHALSSNLDDEIFAFLDTYLKGAPALNDVTPVTVRKVGNTLRASWDFSGPRKVNSAELYVSLGDNGNWRCRAWSVLPATVNGNHCTAVLPASSLPYYLTGTIIDADAHKTSTPLLRVDPAVYNLLVKDTLPPIDGCLEWGDFEKAQTGMPIKYAEWGEVEKAQNRNGFLAMHGYRCPPLSDDAHTGAQSVVIQGNVTMPPAHFIAGVPQQLSCWMKADKPTEVAITFNETADGEKYTAAKTAAIGPGWTQITLDLQPITGYDTSQTLTFTAPKDVKVLLDTVTLKPVTAH
jgi:hypothetical protein